VNEPICFIVSGESTAGLAQQSGRYRPQLDVGILEQLADAKLQDVDQSYLLTQQWRV
jgi:hypothetical protein